MLKYQHAPIPFEQKVHEFLVDKMNAGSHSINSSQECCSINA